MTWSYLRQLWLLAAIAVALLATGTADAHVMVAQRGTLNLVNDGAFMVMSVPASAFRGVDDDADGRLSEAELSVHHADIVQQVQRGVQLRDDAGVRPLHGLLVNGVFEHGQADKSVTQILLMGRFALQPQVSAAEPRPLQLGIDLFGGQGAEQTLRVKVSRGADAELLVFSPDRPRQALLASAWTVFKSYVLSGAEHVLSGFDHLLFLVVVLAAGWRWRQVLIALSLFTVGHAITLVATVSGSLALPARFVEPAIAATIVGMAVCDWYVRRRHQTRRSKARLALVFVCALIHGMGFASSFGELGINSTRTLQSLAGFNLGIELAQAAVACGFAAMLVGLRRYCRPSRVMTLLNGVSLVAIVVGCGWFVQRIV